MKTTLPAIHSIESLLGEEAENLLTYQAKYPKENLHLPGSDFIERVFVRARSQSASVKKSTTALFNGSLSQYRVSFNFTG